MHTDAHINDMEKNTSDNIQQFCGGSHR